MVPTVPRLMRAVLLKSFNPPDNLVVDSILIPTLRFGEVLVRIGAASINPSDLVFLRNRYGIKKTLPIVPGFEGAGTVVAAKGALGRALLGRRVACRAPENGHGTWAEYMVCRASACIPLLKTITIEEGSSLMINPFTAWALMDIVKKGGHKAFIQTGAAGALGKMLIRLARREGIEVVNIVRRREQVELLKTLRCVYVLNCHQKGFNDQLKALCQRLKIRIALDAVGGELTASISSAMMHGARVIVFGALSGDPCVISPASLIFEGKHLEGFWLTEWVKHRSNGKNLWTTYQIQRLLKQELRTDVQARFPLDKIHEAIKRYMDKRSDGKVLIVP